MEEALGIRVKGQDAAIKTVSEAVRLARTGLGNPNRQVGSFLFVCPSGTGKTELAKALAEFLFHSESSLIRFDMSEFMEEHSVSKLILRPLETRPRTRQQRHPLTGANGRKCRFRTAVIILTSTSARGNSPRRKKWASAPHPYQVKPLQPAHIRDIVGKCLSSLNARLAERQITVSLSPEVVDLIVKEGFSPEYGGRELERTIERLISHPLAEAILADSIKSGPVVASLKKRIVVFRAAG